MSPAMPHRYRGTSCSTLSAKHADHQDAGQVNRCPTRRKRSARRAQVSVKITTPSNATKPDSRSGATSERVTARSGCDSRPRPRLARRPRQPAPRLDQPERTRRVARGQRPRVAPGRTRRARRVTIDLARPPGELRAWLLARREGSRPACHLERGRRPVPLRHRGGDNWP